jgi:hypothetical protein
VAYYLKDVTADVILRAHGIGRDGNDFLMVARTPSPFINARRTALLMLGQILPEDFDDDTRITSAQLQHHPPDGVRHRWTQGRPIAQRTQRQL